MMLVAPAGELAQVQRVSVAGQAGIPGQESRQREPFCVAERGLGDGDAVDVDVVTGIVHLPGRAETWEAGPDQAQQR